jgi:hypothetical protein
VILYDDHDEESVANFKKYMAHLRGHALPEGLFICVARSSVMLTLLIVNSIRIIFVIPNVGSFLFFFFFCGNQEIVFQPITKVLKSMRIYRRKK